MGYLDERQCYENGRMVWVFEIELIKKQGMETAVSVYQGQKRKCRSSTTVGQIEQT